MSDTERTRHTTYEPTFTQTWGDNPHLGRNLKRALSKARRRAWKQEVWQGRVYRGLAKYETEVNWRGW